MGHSKNQEPSNSKQLELDFETSRGSCSEPCELVLSWKTGTSYDKLRIDQVTGNAFRGVQKNIKKILFYMCLTLLLKHDQADRYEKQCLPEQLLGGDCSSAGTSACSLSYAMPSINACTAQQEYVLTLADIPKHFACSYDYYLLSLGRNVC